MKRMVAILMVVAITISPTYADDIVYKQSKVYKKAIKKFDKHCTGLDKVHIAALRKSMRIQAELGRTKGAMLKDVRKLTKERGISKEFNHCLVAIVYLERAPFEYAAKQKEIELEKLTKLFTQQRNLKVINSLTKKELDWIKYTEHRKRLVAEGLRNSLAGWIQRGGSKDSRYYIAKRREISALETTDTLWPASLKARSIGSMGHMSDVEIIQIQDDGNSLIRYNDSDELLWLKGVSMDGLVNGKKVILEGVYEITSTTKYTTAIGSSNTVYIIEPMELNPVSLAQLDKGIINEIVANH